MDGDGHPGADATATPILPSGAWDSGATTHDLVEWRHFQTALGTFDPLVDDAGRQLAARDSGSELEALLWCQRPRSFL